MFFRVVINTMYKGHYWRGAGYCWANSPSELLEVISLDFKEICEDVKDTMGMHRFDSMMFYCLVQGGIEYAAADDWVKKARRENTSIVRWTRQNKIEHDDARGVPLG